MNNKPSITNNDKYSICIFLCWYGPVPPYYPAWRKTVLKNSSIDFYIFTDQEAIVSENNIKVTHISFDELRELFQSKFSFQIVLDKPYKLCDYKPAYGYIFREITRKYAYWGYCDMDMVFGDIRKYITNEILDNYLRLFVTGFFNINKSNKQMILLFKNNGKYPEYNYKEVYSTDDACYFDEFRGMEPKCYRNNIDIFKSSDEVVYSQYKQGFYNSSGESVLLKWEEGKLFECTFSGKEREILLAHFHDRPMECEHALGDTFYMTQNSITNYLPEMTSYTPIQEKKYKWRFYYRRMNKKINSKGYLHFIKMQIRRKHIEKYTQVIKKKCMKSKDLSVG